MKGRRYNSNFQQTIYEDFYVVSMSSCLHQFIGYLRSESGVCKRGASRLREVCMIDNHHYINKRPKARHHNEMWSFQQDNNLIYWGVTQKTHQKYSGWINGIENIRINELGSGTLEAPNITYELRRIIILSVSLNPM